MAAPLIKKINALNKRLEGAVEASRSTEQAIIGQKYVEQQQIFLAEHDDGLAVIQDNLDEFQEWVDDQPRRIRDAFEANKDEMTDAAAAIELVSAFKGFLNGEDAQTSSAPDGGKPKPGLSSKRRRQMDGARTSQNRGGAPSNPTSGAGSEDERIWNDFARQDKERERASNR